MIILLFFFVNHFDFARKTQPRRIFIRKNKQFHLNNFKERLSSFNWTDLLNQENLDVNQLYNKFSDVISSLHNECMPTVNVKNDKHKYPRSEWITPSLIRSIKYRDRLYVKLEKLHLLIICILRGKMSSITITVF